MGAARGSRDMYHPEYSPSVAINELLIPPSARWTAHPLLVPRRDTINPLCPDTPTPLVRSWTLQLQGPPPPRARNIAHVTNAVNVESSEDPGDDRSVRSDTIIKSWLWESSDAAVHGQTMKLGGSVNRKVVTGETMKEHGDGITSRWRRSRRIRVVFARARAHSTSVYI